ncbi:hypothetical protein JCM18918_3708 [Cutibacterium acnes JCM 18918]|nr:hypothetical protein JCM18918_3708 [Cutibacterium acnes JCM 18918]
MLLTIVAAGIADVVVVWSCALVYDTRLGAALLGCWVRWCFRMYGHRAGRWRRCGGHADWSCCVWWGWPCTRGCVRV